MHCFSLSSTYRALVDAPTAGDAAVLGTVFTIEDSYYNKSRFFTIDVSSFPYALTAETRVVDTNDVFAPIAMDGAGTFDDPVRNITSNNLLIKVDNDGVIEQVVGLPVDVNAIQFRFGFEGVAEDGDHLVVAFQRAWNDEANPRLGVYNKAHDMWKFLFYPLDTVESQNGGWVGLSEISPLGNGQFFVLERDDQGKQNDWRWG